MKYDKSKSILLCAAVEVGRFTEVHELIEGGADVNYKYKGLYTPLMLAIIRRNSDFVNLFVEKYDASVLIQNHDGQNAITLAKEWGNKTVIKKITRAAAIEMKKKYSRRHSVITVISGIISEITGIKTEEITEDSHMERDLCLYSNYDVTPNNTLLEALGKIENHFWLDSKMMDHFYYGFFDPQVKGEPTIGVLADMVMAVIVNRDRISV
jgi:ankyrin repeat protein